MEITQNCSYLIDDISYLCIGETEESYVFMGFWPEYGAYMKDSNTKHSLHPSDIVVIPKLTVNDVVTSKIDDFTNGNIEFKF